MPDHKISLSSADEPLFDESSIVAPVAGIELPKAGKRHQLLLVVGGIASVLMLLVICAIIAAFVCFRYCAGLSSRPMHSGHWIAGTADDRIRGPLYTSLVFDAAVIPACQQPLSLDSVLPCRKDMLLLTGGAPNRPVDKPKQTYPIGPMVCRDDAFSQSGETADNCKGNIFELAFNRSAVIIPENGVYMVHSTVTFYDTLDYYVSTVIRIDPAKCVKDPVCAASSELRDSLAHVWLSCTNHNVPVSEKGKKDTIVNRFTTCSINGLRRFNRGDAVSVHVTQAYRSINPFHKSTNLYIHKV